MSETKNEIVINAIPIVQKGNTFYLSKISARDLIRISTIHVRGSSNIKKTNYIEEVKEIMSIQTTEDGIQRGASISRLKEIAKYLESQDGFIPNSILVALNNKVDFNNDERPRLYDTDGYDLTQLANKELENDILKCLELEKKVTIQSQKNQQLENVLEKSGIVIKKVLGSNIVEITIHPDKVDAFVVDGQHRLGAFAYSEKIEQTLDEFELPLVLFIEMQIPLQAELFRTINGKQKPVNKSLLYDLREYGKDEYDIIKRCHLIAKWFNENEESPFFQTIKMLGTGLGSLSQSAFIDELKKYVIERKTRIYKSIFKDLSNEEIIQFLYVYFCAIKDTYHSEIWENTEKYLFLKTTGFGVMMKSLYYVYIMFAVDQREFSYENLKALMEKLPSNMSFSTYEYGGIAGQGYQKNLSVVVLEILFGDRTKLDIMKYLAEVEQQYARLV